MKHDYDANTIECTEKEIENMQKGQRYFVSIGKEITHFLFCENELKVCQADINTGRIPMKHVVIIKEVHDS